MPSFTAPSVNLVLRGGGQISVCSSPADVVKEFNKTPGNVCTFESYSQFQKHPMAQPTLNEAQLTIDRDELIGYIITKTGDANIVFDPEKQARIAQGGMVTGRVPHIGR